MTDAFIGPLITATAILISATIAIAIAVYNYKWATNEARKRATFEHINSKNWNSDYLKAKIVYLAALNAGDPNIIVKSAISHQEGSTNDDDGLSLASATRLILNDYETLFIAIEGGILDVNIVKSWHKNTIIKDYQSTKSYIDWVRNHTGNQSIFEVFERNALKWMAA